MDEVKLKDLLEAGCHFGHQAARWNPKMKRYIFTARDNVHIFDLVKTKEGLEAAAEFAKKIVAEGGKVVLVGTKKQAKDLIKEAGIKTGMPYVSERWVGGTITNWDKIKKNIENLIDLKERKAAGEFKEYTKKENLLIDRQINKLEYVYGGLVSLAGLPEAIFVIDVKREIGAVKEASGRNISVIGVVDTNSDPDLVDLVIPANDDAAKSVHLIVGFLTQALEEGNRLAEKAQKTKEEKEEKEEKEKKAVEEEVIDEKFEKIEKKPVVEEIKTKKAKKMKVEDKESGKE